MRPRGLTPPGPCPGGEARARGPPAKARSPRGPAPRSRARLHPPHPGPPRPCPRALHAGTWRSTARRAQRTQFQTPDRATPCPWAVWIIGVSAASLFKWVVIVASRLFNYHEARPFRIVWAAVTAKEDARRRTRTNSGKILLRTDPGVSTPCQCRNSKHKHIVERRTKDGAKYRQRLEDKNCVVIYKWPVFKTVPLRDI